MVMPLCFQPIAIGPLANLYLDFALRLVISFKAVVPTPGKITFGNIDAYILAEAGAGG